MCRTSTSPTLRWWPRGVAVSSCRRTGPISAAQSSVIKPAPPRIRVGRGGEGKGLARPREGPWFRCGGLGSCGAATRQWPYMYVLHAHPRSRHVRGALAVPTPFVLVRRRAASIASIQMPRALPWKYSPGGEVLVCSGPGHAHGSVPAIDGKATHWPIMRTKSGPLRWRGGQTNVEKHVVNHG